MNHRNKAEYDILNITQAIDFFKDKDTSRKILNIAVWDSTKDPKYPKHGEWSYNLMLEGVRECFSEDEVKIHYIEMSDDKIEDIKNMLDLDVHICTHSIVGYSLEWYKHNEFVREFLDKVYFINSAGNSESVKVEHPAPPEELTAEACYLDAGNHIKWSAYSNHEEGFKPDCASLTNIFVEKSNKSYSGTSCSGQTMGLTTAFTFKYFEWYNNRFPTTKETNALTYENFFIPFTSMYKGKGREHRLSVLIPDMNIEYEVKEDNTVIVKERKLIASVQVDNPNYMLNGKEYTFSKGSDGLDTVPFVKNGRMFVPLDFFRNDNKDLKWNQETLTAEMYNK